MLVSIRNWTETIGWSHDPKPLRCLGNQLYEQWVNGVFFTRMNGVKMCFIMEYQKKLTVSNMIIVKQEQKKLISC